MATKVQITGGAYQDAFGNPLANGYLLLTLSQDSQVEAQEVSAGITIKAALDGSGNVVTDPAVNIWPNDVLSPANTFYNVSGYTAEGQLVWGPNAQQILSSPSPYDIGAWVPGAVNTLNPGGNITGLIAAGTNITLTGSGTGTSPYTISSSGGSGGVTSFNTRTGDVTLESSDVTTALTYTPVNKAGDTMTGLLVLSADPTANLGAATKQYVDSSSGTAITALTGDVTASGPGSAAASVVKVNGASVPASHAYVGTNSSGQIISATTPLLPANNLSDVSSASTARTNLGLGTIATQDASAVDITGGTASLTSVSLGGSQSVSSVQGTTGTKVAAATGSFTSGNLTATDAHGNLVDSGVASSSASTPAFSSLAGGTNNASAMVVGPSASLNWAGSLDNLLGPNISNTSTGLYAGAQVILNNGTGTGSGNAQFFKASTGYIGYKSLKAGDFSVISNGTGNISFLNDGIGDINFSAQSASPQFTITSTGITSTVPIVASQLGTTQTATASTTASDHSIPIVVNGTTYYMRLSSTP